MKHATSNKTQVVYASTCDVLLQKRQRKERRERRRLIALGEISPNRETNTTYGSDTGSRSGSRRDLGSSFRSLSRAGGSGGPGGPGSDRDRSSSVGGGGGGGPWSSSRRGKKKLPEPTAPDERLLHERGRRASSARYSSTKSSPRSWLSKRKSKSKSDSALQDVGKQTKKKSNTWDQNNRADIRHIDSSSSSVDEQDPNIGDRLTTKSTVTVTIEHVNDNEQPEDLKDGLDAESQTANDNLNNNIEEASVEVVAVVKDQSDSDEKESDTEHMDTKVTDSESDDNKDTERKVHEERAETYTSTKKRKKREDSEETDENEDAAASASRSPSDDVMSENLSDYDEPRDLSSAGSDEAHALQVESPSPPEGEAGVHLRDHHEVHLELVVEGYYKSIGQNPQNPADSGGRAELDSRLDNVHDSGINTPDLTTDIDPLSPTEKDFFFNRDGEFDDTFSEIFYDAEIDFERSSRGGSAEGGFVQEGFDQFSGHPQTRRQPLRDVPDQTSLTMLDSEEEFLRSDDLMREICTNIESDRKLVAAMLERRKYAEVIEVTDVPEDLKFPHERFPQETDTDATKDRYSSSLSICSECSLSREQGKSSPRQQRAKFAPGSPKRRSKDTLDVGLPVCYECRCTIAHYSYSSQTKPLDHLGHTLSNYCDVVFSDSALKAMSFNIDTLDREGPGFIFVLAENNDDAPGATTGKMLPWTTAQRYKIASSRHPDRWVLELQSRDIELHVVWQIRVQNHVTAVREVYACLDAYNLHSNWFRCPLAVIIENVLNIASKYRVARHAGKQYTTHP